LKTLAAKVAVALPGVTGAVILWLLKTTGWVATWLAEHLWALAGALVIVAAVWAVFYCDRYHSRSGGNHCEQLWAGLLSPPEQLFPPEWRCLAACECSILE